MRSLLVRSLVAALVSCLLGVTAGQSQPIGCQTFYDGFTNPYDVTTDSSGNLYVADRGTQGVYKVSSTGSSSGGTSNTLQTYQVTNPALNSPDGLCLDNSGNVYVVDSGNQRVLKFNNAGVFQSVVVANSTSTPLNYPWSCVVDSTNNFLYVPNTSGQTVLKLNLATTPATLVLTIAPTNPGFLYPNQVALDSSLNLYVADSNNARVVKFSPAGVQQQVFNMPTGSYPNGVAVDTNGAVYVTNTAGGVLEVFNAAGVNVYNFTTTNPAMNNPRGVWTDSQNNIYIADSGNTRIIKLYSSTSGFNGGNVGCGQAPSAANVNGYSVTSLYTTSGVALNNPYDVALDSSNNLYVADTNNARAVKMTSGGAVLQTYTAPGTALNGPNGVCVDSSNYVYVVDTQNARVVRFNNDGTNSVVIGAGATPALLYPWNCAVDSSGRLFVSDTSNQVVSVFNAGTASAGGTFLMSLNVSSLYPNQITIDSSSTYLYVADSSYFNVLKFSIATALATTFPAPVAIAQTFYMPSNSYPNGVAVDSSGNVYATESVTNGTILQWNSAGTLQSSFNLGSNTLVLNSPRGLAITSGGTIYVADSNNNRIVVFSKGGGNGASSTLHSSSVAVVLLAALLSLFFSP